MSPSETREGSFFAGALDLADKDTHVFVGRVFETDLVAIARGDQLFEFEGKIVGE